MTKVTLSEIQHILSLRSPDPAPHAFMDKGEEVFIYGAGNCGKDVLNLLQTEGIKVCGFLDSNLVSGSLVAGVPVRHPSDETFSPERRSGCCVIVAIFNTHVDLAALIETLKSYGYSHVITFVEFFRYFPAQLGDRFWLTKTDFYTGHETELVKAGELLQDEESRRLFLALLAYRMTGNHGRLPAPSTETQYFDRSLTPWHEPISFIDCGSYGGETISDLLQHYGEIDTIIAFEPDQENFKQLAARMRIDLSLCAKQAFLYPCGVWSETAMLSFAADGGTSSALSSQGTSRVQCMALDDALPGFRPTLIKMDIEGAELQALKGAHSMIEKNRPGLAISVYHAPEHLWEIALLLDNWALGYRFYLRCYRHTSFDTILYAFPT
jgi:FkbM family methyltransferase